ncbi:MAG: GAF and ANTAR domain-containing protein [Aeromicrobium sp.]
MPGQMDTEVAHFVESLHQDVEMDLEQAMTRIVEFAGTTVGVKDGSIFLAHRTAAGVLYDTIVPTSAEVVKVDEIQHEVAQGPSLDAIAAEDTVFAPDLRVDDRWPRWRTAALDVGIGGVVSARLQSRGRTIGALNLYTREPERLSSSQAMTLELLAKHAAAALAAAMDHSSLTQALLTRSVIGRAQGVLMERYGLEDARAFAVLKRYSQDSNTKLRDVAARILDGEEPEGLGSASRAGSTS